MRDNNKNQSKVELISLSGTREEIPESFGCGYFIRTLSPLLPEDLTNRMAENLIDKGYHVWDKVKVTICAEPANN